MKKERASRSSLPAKGNKIATREPDHGLARAVARSGKIVIQDSGETAGLKKGAPEAEGKYRLIADNTSDFEFWIDPRGRFIYASPSSLDVTGYRPKDFLADPGLLRRIVHPDDLKAFDRHRREVKKHAAGKTEWRLVKKDGSVCWIAHVCQPVFSDQGEYLGERGSNRDMTEHKRDEAALRASEERYHSLFDKINEGFALHEIICNKKGVPVDYRFLEINHAFEELTGLKREAVIGRLHSRLLPGDSPRWVKMYGKVALTGKPAQFENYSPVLKRHYAVLAFSPAPKQFAVLFTDVSEQRRRETELRKLNRTLKALSNSTQAMMQASAEAEYLRQICRIIVRDCGHKMAWIGYSENDREKSIRPVAHAGFEKGYLETLRLTWADRERGRGPTGTAIRTGKTVICRNMLEDPRFAPWREEARRRGYISSLAIPLLAEGRAFGAITIYSQEADPFLAAEVDLLRELAERLAYGIRALRLRQEHARAEEALQVTLTKYQVLFDSFPLGISITDAKGNVIESNREAERLLELSKEEHERRKVDGREWRIVRPDGKPMPQAEFASVRALRKKRLVENVEMGLARRKGDITWINVSAAPIPLEGYGVAVTYGDISERKRIERALQESTNYLENLLNYANAPIIVWDPSFRIIRFNHAFERLTGHKAAQVRGRPLDMLFPGASKSESLKLIRDTLKGRHWEVVEIPILQKSGAIRTVLWNSANIHDRDGAVVATIAQGQDITERKRVEEALRQSESILHSFFDSPGIRREIIDLIDDTDIRHIASNQETARYYGLTPGAMRNKTSLELGESPETVRLWIDFCKKSRRSRRPASFEFPLRHGDQEIWQSVVITYLGRISRGQHRFSHVIIDISERKRMEKALQESTNYLENLLNYANAPIIVWDPSFRIIRFNHAFERLTGHTASQVHGRPLNMLFPDASKSESLKLIRDTLKGRHWEVVEIPILQKSGAIRTVLWNSANIHDRDGAVVATIAQGQDITERKQTEEQVEASLHEKEMLLRELYHRTKNNMNVISSLVSLQGASVKDPGVLRMFSDMQSRIRTMSLVHEKLYQSSDLFNLDIREYINDLAGTILAGYKNSAARISLNLDIESVPFSIDTALPCGLVINELMTNSLKYAFSEEMTGEIGISLRRLPEDEVTMCYYDNGIGFPEGFDPLKPSSLGLKLVNSLVRKQLLGKLQFIEAPGVRVEIRFKKANIERPEKA